jgi:WD40 repeat protein
MNTSEPIDISKNINQISPERQQYILSALPFHLAESLSADKLRILLTNYSFISKKIEKFGPQPTIDDFQLTKYISHLLGPEYIESLALLEEALQMTAHILITDPRQLKTQLIARLIYYEQPTIQNFLHQARGDTRLWLEPLRSALTEVHGPLGRTLVGHSGAVNTLSITPDGKQIVSGSSDNTIKVWDMQSGTELFSLIGHTSIVNKVVLTADGTKAVSASYDKTIKIWDLRYRKEIATLKGHTDTVNEIAITPDGKWLASVSEDRMLKFWDLERDAEIRTFERDWGVPRKVAITPNGKYMIANSGENNLGIWELNGDNARPFLLIGHTRLITAVVVTPNGKLIVSTSSDGTLRIWDLAVRREVAILKEHQANALALTPDGRYIVSAGNNEIKVWSIPSDSELKMARSSEIPISLAPLSTIQTYPHNPDCIAISADGHTAVTGAFLDRNLKIWNLRHKGNAPRPFDHSDSIELIEITADGRHAISASASTLKIWDTQRAICLHTIHPRLERSTYGSKVVLTGDCKFVFYIAHVPALKRPSSIAPAFDTLIEVWDLVHRKEKCQLRSLNHYSEKAAVTSDGRYIVSASNWSHWNCLITAWDIENQVEILTSTLEVIRQAVTAITITPDGQQVIFATENLSIPTVPEEYLIHRLDLRSQEILTFNGYHKDKIHKLVVHPDGKRLLSVSGDSSIKVWNIAKGVELKTLSGHGKSVYKILVSKDGQRAISVSGDRLLKIWDLEQGVEMHSQFYDVNYVTSIKATSDWRLAITASTDSSLAVWDLEKGELLNGFSGDSKINDCAITPDGAYIVAGEEAGRIHFLQLEGLQ